MALVNEKTAAEIADGVRAAKSAAQSALGEQMERRKQRIKSVSKTRKSRATRERIMTAASELMVERGNTDFQMSEVSARCHMSKGALYYYFSDKDELVEAVFEASGDELVSAIEEAVSQAASAREALESLFSELARRMRTRSPLVLALTVELSSTGGELFSAVSGQLSRIVRIIGELLERGKGEGFVRQDVDTSLAAVYLCGGLVGTTVASASGVMQGSEAMGLSLMELLAHGVAPLGSGSVETTARQRGTSSRSRLSASRATQAHGRLRHIYMSGAPKGRGSAAGGGGRPAAQAQGV